MGPHDQHIDVLLGHHASRNEAKSRQRLQVHFGHTLLTLSELENAPRPEQPNTVGEAMLLSIEFYDMLERMLFDYVSDGVEEDRVSISHPIG
jgi:hypothetical protein